MRASLENGGRADPLLRRRPRRPQGGLSGDRHGSAADRPRTTLRFALLPEGQDPDDLVRSGGAQGDRGASSRQRWPLADLIWMRETEAQDARDAGTARRPRAPAERDDGRDRRRDAAALLQGMISRSGYFAACSASGAGGGRAIAATARKATGEPAASARRRGVEWARHGRDRAPPVASAALSRIAFVSGRSIPPAGARSADSAAFAQSSRAA